MASTYSTSSLVGFVSSNRRLHVPPRSAATPKLRQIDFAWPMCRYPLGSGGNLVATRPWCLPDARSSSTIVRMKSTGRAGAVDPGSSDMVLVNIILVITTTLRLKPPGDNRRGARRTVAIRAPGEPVGRVAQILDARVHVERSVFHEKARGAL